ncbi:MAG TPA: BON domain-containing protein [Gaiellaceae bacterium]|jgi:osmotically-inducible protein OsmY|nr:BON domain-containing protein [Gaiellaceae bacterium]
MLKDDRTLQADVIRELSWEPAVTAAHIGVTANGGAITLTGRVPTYGEKQHAVEAAERVFGVRAVADEIEITFPGSHRRDDAAIAEAIAQVLRWDTQVPDTVEGRVCRGWVTLKGSVNWPFEREAAMRTIHHITAVRGITNEITVKSKPKTADLRKRIEDAFTRMADLDAGQIQISIADGTVYLEGQVHSLQEAKVAENAAAAAPDVSEIDNRLSVIP